MKGGQASTPQGATGRADLLRALAMADRDRLALDFDGITWFGYVRRPEEPPRLTETELIDALPPAEVEAAPTSHYKLPLQLPFLHLIVQREQRPPREAVREATAPRAAPIDEQSARAPSDVRLVGYEDLIPQARLLPALRRALGATRPGPLDLERLTQELAARELPRRLPRRALHRWHPELVVLLDFCARLVPYREDMHRLTERLLCHCGRSGLSLRIVNEGPFGPWSDWLAHQNQLSSAEPPLVPWTMPAAGTPVLIVSDLGLLLGAGSAECRSWAQFINTLMRAEVRPVALVPLSTGQLDATLPAALPILRWSPEAWVRPTRAHGIGQREPEGLDDLLAMAAATRRVDPPLLRALRRLNPRAPLNAGLEGALWCHADVEAGFTAAIRREAQETHLRRFRERLAELHEVHEALRSRHHAHLRAVLNREETLLWSVDPEAIKAAEHFMRRIAATLAEPGSGQSAANWWVVAQGIVERADGDMGLRYSEVLQPLVATLVRVQGGQAKIPTWADPAVLKELLGDRPVSVSAWLVRNARSGCLVLQAEPSGNGQSPLGEPLMLDAGGARVSVGEGTGAVTRWLSASALPQQLCRLSEPVPVEIVTAGEVLTVAAVRRPRGALGWGCDRRGSLVQSPALGRHAIHWLADRLRVVAVPGAPTPAWALEADAAELSRSDGAIRFGIDAPYGVYADFTVTTRHGSATQRLRYIEPGTFLMGSPEDEPERSDREGPRHPVTLTRGFWLADSACTQRLWRTVMGKIPSRFEGDEECPVERVSWHDVQGFLRKMETLETLLPGCTADLPTEAEWEYACRAGSDTPFSFGLNISPEVVNYDGNYPYAGGKKGLYREKTVPVKSLPPNAWGLYEMHGNVWEWCADGIRPYCDQDEVDPMGPVDPQADRAVRGGSWGGLAGWARSADRSGALPGFAIDDLGFRLCLRSIEPGPSRPGGSAVFAPGGREPPGPPRDEAG